MASDIPPGRLELGRNLESIRMGVKYVSARWLIARKVLKKEDQVYRGKLTTDRSIWQNE